MPLVAIQSARRVAGEDLITVRGLVDGMPAVVNVWWSHLAPLSPAQRKRAVAQALAAATEPALVEVSGLAGGANVNV